MSEVVTVKAGDHVIYTDESSVEHHALITAVHGGSATHPPSLNVVYVDGDAAKTDSYGRQIIRQTSQPHQSSQQAPGRFWR